jgi:outer membrane receptor protein involved in Fe transport
MVRSGISFAALCVAMSSAAAQAQATTSAEAPPAAAETTGQDSANGEREAGAGDIVVTAQRRSERLQDVPIAVNVATEEQLVNSGVRDLQQLAAIVPGLNVTAALGSFQPSIRGIATSSNIVENPVSLYIDGVYLPQQQDGLRDLDDVEQITVLKGPQGTLFGRNATAGVIQITTKGPTFIPAADLRVSYGSYQTVRASAFVSGGLAGDSVAGSLSVAYRTQGRGWGRSLSAGFESNKLKLGFSARSKLLFKLGDSTTATLIGDHLEREDSGRVFQPYPGTRLSYPGFGPVRSRYDTYSGTPGFTRFTSNGAGLTVDSDLGFAKLVSITSYREGSTDFKFDLTGVAAPLLVSTAASGNKNFSQELQLVSPSGRPFTYVLGGYYFYNSQGYDFFNRDFASAAINPVLSRSASSGYEKTRSIAPFAQADWEFLPRTTLTLGARYTHETRELNDGTTRLTRLVGGLQPLVIVPPKSLEFNKLTYRVALNHKFSEDVLLYGSYNRGFKSGGFNIATPAAAGYLPETLDDFEVGLKTQLFDRRLTFNVNGFYYKYSNIQVASFVGNPPSQIILNGAKAKLYGADIDFSARIGGGLTISGGAEFVHPYFTDYRNAPIGVDLAAGGVATAPGDATGKRVPFARTFVGTLAADYAVDIGPAKLTLNVTGTRSGDYFFEPDNVVRQPAYTMLNASVRLSDRDDRLSLMFGVTNATDESIIVTNATAAFGRFVSYATPPREYTVTARAKF